MGKKKNKGYVSLVGGLLAILSSLMCLAGIVLQVLGKLPSFLVPVLGILGSYCGFGQSSSYFLIPLVLVLFVLGVCCFSFRGKNPFSFFLFPVVALLFFTLNFLFEMKFSTPHPRCLYTLLLQNTTERMASLFVAFSFIIEIGLFSLVSKIASSLNGKYQKRKAFQEKLAFAKANNTFNLDDYSAKEQKKIKKQDVRLQKEKRKEDARHQLKDKNKKKDDRKDESTAEVTMPQPNEGELKFPALVDMPSLDYLTKKKVEVESKAPEETAVTEIEALSVIKEKVERNFPIQKPLEVSNEPTKKKFLSGLLQGALEAVGKAPKPKTGTTSAHLSKGKGLLVTAVEENTRNNKDLKVEGSSFSRAVPLLDQQEITVEKEPLKKPMPSLENTSVVQYQERVISVVPHKENEEPPEDKSENAEDDLQSACGVGGLSSSNEGKSALINRGKLDYHFPPADILVDYPHTGSALDEETQQKGVRLVQTLAEFNVKVELVNIIKGPTVTMFEILPAPGIRVNQIVGLADNIQLRLPATQIRIVAPIPGKTAVGVEVPNAKRETIGFKEMLPSMDSKNYKIPMVLGKNLLGESLIIDVANAPHLLIAGATGSGKSVCVNSLISSILYQKSPKQVRLILVDPKIVELQVYNGIPHLLTPVITDPKRTLKALDFCLYEMDRRYKLLQSLNTRNIIGYNQKVEEGNVCREKLPYIVVIIDEFADLMHTVGKELEAKVSRLTAMSRAVGIHLVLATQRPSVDVITGVIKTNIPSRIAFAVTSNQDSRIIIDEIGAEKLLGKGDMLYVSASDPSATRIQGAFLSDGEVEKVVGFASKQGVQDFIDELFFEEEPQKNEDGYDDNSFSDGASPEDNNDEVLMEQALQIAVERKCASASYLQRRLRIGYNRAARLVEQMEDEGYVGPANGSKPRPLLRYPGSVSLGQQDAGQVAGEKTNDR